MERIQLSEWETTEPLELTEQDLHTLQQEINNNSTKIGVSHTRDGKTKLHTKQYVGIFSLPSGKTIEIRPKAAENNLLNLLRYASGTPVSVIKSQQNLEDGSNLVDTVGQLFLDELKQLLSQGMRREYVRKQSREGYVRGQIQVHKQLQTQRAAPTDFECSYEDLTYDTISNQAILYSTTVLSSLVSDTGLESELSHYRELLKNRVTLKQVQPVELEQIKINRLKQDYQDILQLCELVITSSFVESLETGLTQSYSFLLDMNTVFEKVVERAFTEVLQNQDCRVQPQHLTDNLVSGTPRINMYPDIMIESNEDSVLVADAKWKTSTQNSDIYQLVSYTLAHQTPGILIYPEQQGERETQYKVKTGEKLHLIEISTKSSRNFEEWHKDLNKSLTKSLRQVLSH